MRDEGFGCCCGRDWDLDVAFPAGAGVRAAADVSLVAKGK